MRISDERYRRDLARHDLALRLIRHEVRTHTISTWTGLSPERIRSLCRTYASNLKHVRHRGPPPQSLDGIMQSAGLRNEAAAIAGVCYALGVVPAKPHTSRSTPTVDWGERLCDAYELYRHIVPDSPLKLEQVILLVTTLARKAAIVLDRCTQCEGAILIDQAARQRRLCRACKRKATRPSSEVARRPEELQKSIDVQPSLF